MWPMPFICMWGEISCFISYSIFFEIKLNTDCSLLPYLRLQLIFHKCANHSFNFICVCFWPQECLWLDIFVCGLSWSCQCAKISVILLYLICASQRHAHLIVVAVCFGSIQTYSWVMELPKHWNLMFQFTSSFHVCITAKHRVFFPFP